MDRNIEREHAFAAQPFGIVLLRARSNRMMHLSPLIPALLEALDRVTAGEILRVGV